MDNAGYRTTGGIKLCPQQRRSRYVRTHACDCCAALSSTTYVVEGGGDVGLEYHAAGELIGVQVGTQKTGSGYLTLVRAVVATGSTSYERSWRLYTTCHSRLLQPRQLLKAHEPQLRLRTNGMTTPPLLMWIMLLMWIRCDEP